MRRTSAVTVAVIVGTGVTEQFEFGRGTVVRTPYGNASAYLSPGGRFWIIPRHGPQHTLPPHRINYRANVAALRKLGVESVVATCAVGSMREDFAPGQLGLVDQFIDFTRSRRSTFFDEKVVHTDMTHPYSREVDSAVAEAARRLTMELRMGLVYICVDGPRYETAAEIKMFRAMGGDVVGMTGVPEAVLANEAGLRYSSVVVATNWAAGISARVSHDEVLSVMREQGSTVKKLLEETVNVVQAHPSRREASK